MLPGSGIILQSDFEMLIGKLLKNDWKESWRDRKVDFGAIEKVVSDGVKNMRVCVVTDGEAHR